MLRPIASEAIAIAVAGAAAGSLALGLWLWPGAEPFAKAAFYPLISAISAQGETPPAAAPGAELAATTIEAAGPAKGAATTLTQPGDERPAFDIVRVEPTGEAVIAGHSSKNSAVELRVDGRAVAGVNADSLGDFTILPPRFAAGAHRLELAAGGDPTAPALSDAVSIDVPAQAGEPPQTPAPPFRNAALPPETSPVIAGPSAASGPEAALSNPQAAPAVDASGAMTYRPHAPANRLRLLLDSARAAEAKRDSDLLAIAPPSAPESDVATPRGGGHAAK
jgi:hypothetical protein